jgi:glycosyltransferase involved in cell wall biosynthesis
VFHILWNNKFEWFDRTALLLYYKLCGRKVVFTAHNVNTQARDGKDSWFNRFTLKMFYRRLDQIFVHTTRMKQELLSEYDVSAAKVTVIPFGINNTLPRSALTRAEARQRLGLEPTDKTILFFGNIAPYKGLEYLLEAFSRLVAQGSGYKLVVAGQNVKCDPEYWSRLDAMMNRTPERDFIVREIKFIPDSEVELYFKASDLLVLPYTQIFQSGVLFLSYSFGLPVLAADVGALKEEIVEGATGLVCQPQDPSDLAKRINQYFASSLYARLEEEHREKIQGYANDRYSWSKVIALTSACYSNLTGRTSRAGSAEVIAK